MSSVGDSLLYQLQHSGESRQSQIVAVNIVLVACSSVSVALRLLSRRLVKCRLWWDDYTIILAQGFAYCLTAVNILSTRYGLGKHLFAVAVSDYAQTLETQYFFDLSYGTSLAVMKISILLFYYRSFPAQHFRRVLQYMMVFVGSVWISTSLAAIFSCHPVYFFWDKTGDGDCFDLYAFALVGAGLTLATDVLILALPLRMVWKLHISKKKKAALSAIFLLGGFVCIASAIRIPTIHDLYFSSDPTWTAFAPAVWTLLEINIGLICANLPIMRPLVVRVWRRKIFDSFRSAASTTACGPHRYMAKYSSEGGSNNKAMEKSIWSDFSTQSTDLGSPDVVVFHRLDVAEEVEVEPKAKGNRMAAAPFLPPHLEEASRETGPRRGRREEEEEDWPIVSGYGHGPKPLDLESGRGARNSDIGELQDYPNHTRHSHRKDIDSRS